MHYVWTFYHNEVIFLIYRAGAISMADKACISTGPALVIKQAVQIENKS